MCIFKLDTCARVSFLHDMESLVQRFNRYASKTKTNLVTRYTIRVQFTPSICISSNAIAQGILVPIVA